MRRFESQHAERHADVVVEVVGARRTGESQAEHSVNHLTRRSLADTAGDRDHLAAELLTNPSGQLLQRLRYVSSTSRLQQPGGGCTYFLPTTAPGGRASE